MTVRCAALVLSLSRASNRKLPLVAYKYNNQKLAKEEANYQAGQQVCKHRGSRSIE